MGEIVNFVREAASRSIVDKPHINQYWDLLTSTGSQLVCNPKSDVDFFFSEKTVRDVSIETFRCSRLP